MNFTSDNAAPASPEIIAALAAANHGAAGSYGADPWTERATALLRDVFEHDVTVFPVATGTAANALALATLVQPYGAVICDAEAHIASDECGAPEFYTGGAKLLTVHTRDGRLTPPDIARYVARAADGGVHYAAPDAVSITQATEWGTLYTRPAIAALGETCRAHGLALHMDGARFANAVAAGASPADLTWRAGVDVLSFGATKNGALAAEAVVYFDPARAASFARRRKRAGQLWSKQRYLSAQLVAYLEHDLWLRNARHANACAARLARGLAALPDVRLVQEVEANEVFAAMPEPRIAALETGGARFYRWIAVPGIDLPVIRLVCSWATAETELDRFLSLAAATAP